MSDKIHEAPEPLRMSAYYYSFDETGVRSVDEILSAVAIAGKAYHHTESWSEPIYSRPESYVDLIQQAAERAAAEIRRAVAHAEETAATLREVMIFVRDVATNYDHDEDAHKYGTRCRECEAKKLMVPA